MAFKTNSKKDPLEGLFGDSIRPRVIRVFLHGVNEAYTPDYVRRVLGITLTTAKKELNSLVKAGILRKKEVFVPIKEGSARKKKAAGFAIDKKYPYFDLMNKLFLNTFPFGQKDISDGIQNYGDIKTILLSGVFVGSPESSADIVIVGSNIKESKIKNLLSQIEKSIGSEIRYMLYEPNDFMHRISISDKGVRGVLDTNYRVSLDKLKIIEKKENPHY